MPLGCFILTKKSIIIARRFSGTKNRNSEEDKMMAMKGKTVYFVAAILVFFLAGQLTAELSPICRFKKVTIPVDLRINDSLLAKGAYDLEFLRANQLSYYLRIMKNGRILQLVQGKEFPYDNSSIIPVKPTLGMSKNHAEKLLTIVFESGSHTVNYGKLRAIYALPYEGE
jgi:hypothetical protein